MKPGCWCPIIVRNSKIPKMLSWFMDIAAITLFPFIFVKGEGDDKLIRHETIHIAKYRNYDDAYRSIRFEREAYNNEHDKNYLEMREKFAWTKYSL